jgi:NLR family CARD domain-containing protein 3
METWYMAGNHIKTEGFQLMVKAMVTSSSITNVWLKWNPLGPSTVKHLVKLILETKNLQTLDLENTELGDAGITALFGELTYKITGLKNIYPITELIALKNIFLNANGIGENGTKAISEAISAGWQPESLMLASNPIGDAGASISPKPSAPTNHLSVLVYNQMAIPAPESVTSA